MFVRTSDCVRLHRVSVTDATMFHSNDKFFYTKKMNNFSPYNPFILDYVTERYENFRAISFLALVAQRIKLKVVGMLMGKAVPFGMI